MTIDRAKKTIEMAMQAESPAWGDWWTDEDALLRFAASLRAEVLEEAAQRLEQLRDEHCAGTALADDPADQCTADDQWCEFVTAWNNGAAAIRGMKSEPGHSVSSVAEASTAPPAEGERNQCDGCARGLPVTGGLHRGEGSWDLQGCTADRYASPQQPTATARELAAMFRQFTKSSHRWHDGRSVHIVAAEVLEHFASQDEHSYRQQTDREYRDEIGKSMEATLRAAAERVLGPICDAAPACPCFDKRGVQLTKCFWGAPHRRSADNVSPGPNAPVLDVPESAGAAERGER